MNLVLLRADGRVDDPLIDSFPGITCARFDVSERAVSKMKAGPRAGASFDIIGVDLGVRLPSDRLVLAQNRSCEKHSYRGEDRKLDDRLLSRRAGRHGKEDPQQSPRVIAMFSYYRKSGNDAPVAVTNLFIKVEIEHAEREAPERLGREICRQILKVYGVRTAEVLNAAAAEE
jgi:hypothetical protein